jgi:hypothetical protein
MTTFAPLSFMHQARCGVSSFLFVSNLPGKYIIYFPSAVNMSVRSHLFSLSFAQDDDSTLTLITQFPPLIEQFYYKIDRSLVLCSQYTHSCIYIRQPALLSLLQPIASYMRRALKTIFETSLAADRFVCCVSDFSSAPPFIIAGEARTARSIIVYV